MYNSTYSTKWVWSRGFRQVVMRDNNDFNDVLSFFSYPAFGVIAELSRNQYSLKELSPFSGSQEYQTRLDAFSTFINTFGNSLEGIVDDFEIYPFSRIYYKTNGDSSNYSTDYNDGRIDNNGILERLSFRNYLQLPPSLDLTLDKIQFNFPISGNVGMTDDPTNIGFMLGYFAPGIPAGEYQRVAQTFKPSHSEITRIDVLIKRFNQDGNLPDFLPAGNIVYYLVETDIDGKPLWGNKLTINKTLKIFSTWGGGKHDVDYYYGNGQEDFGYGTDDLVLPLKLYFNPNEIINLDISKKYAIVLEFTYWEYDPNDWNGGHYRVAATKEGSTGPYLDGKLYKGRMNQTTKEYDDTDMWFKVFYPDPPSNDTPILTQLISNRNVQLLGYDLDHMKIAQTFNINTDRITNIEVNLHTIGSSSGRDIKAYITETNQYGEPTNSILVAFRIKDTELC